MWLDGDREGSVYEVPSEKGTTEGALRDFSRSKGCEFRSTRTERPLQNFKLEILSFFYKINPVILR